MIPNPTDKTDIENFKRKREEMLSLYYDFGIIKSKIFFNVAKSLVITN